MGHRWIFYWSYLHVNFWQGFLEGEPEGPFLSAVNLGFLLDGELFITGRLKNLIIIRGKNYYPNDIETAIEKCHVALRQGCNAAFSIDHDGEEKILIIQEIKRDYTGMIWIK